MLNHVDQKVEHALSTSASAEAYLARAGDKSFIFSESADCFIMYRDIFGYFICLGDPVGTEDSWASAISNFIRYTHEMRKRPIFYKIEKSVEILRELGFYLEKIGEDARLDLSKYSLNGKTKSNLRRKINQAKKLGINCTVLDTLKISNLLPELKSISDIWLGKKSESERGFSVGTLSEQYLQTQKIAVATQDDKIVAFCTINETSTGIEAAIDLMRQDKSSPIGSMHSLVNTVIEYYQSHDFESFNLCMAPLSGLDGERKTILNRTLKRVYADFNYKHRLKGLRQFKEYFNPKWDSKYLATSSKATAYIGGIRLLASAV